VLWLITTTMVKTNENHRREEANGKPKSGQGNLLVSENASATESVIVSVNGKEIVTIEIALNGRETESCVTESETGIEIERLHVTAKEKENGSVQTEKETEEKESLTGTGITSENVTEIGAIETGNIVAVV